MLRAMANVIAHRGPDDEGFYESTAASGTYNVGLAYRRLSIIDLNTGNQPIGNEDDSVQIVFNGEIYNFRTLREELISCGHTFKTDSDTETIVHAYEEYGEECVTHLRGMFAFAIWDAKRELLFMARDRFGKKPLFLWEQGDSLRFASEIKSLLVAGDGDIQVDLDGIYEYLLYRYVPAPGTLIQGIRKLPPASYAVWENGRLDIKRYYTPPDLQPYKKSPVPGKPVKKFLQHLDDAVACRMVSEVKS